MRYKKIGWLIVFLCTFTMVHAGEIEKQWEIFFGRDANNIQTVNDLVLYDFEIYDGKLFLCDIMQNRIKLFDRSGKNIETIHLPASPEIIKIWNGILVVLIQNGQVGVYDIKKKKIEFVDLKIEINHSAYSEAFFSDSLLHIPKLEQYIDIKKDAYKVDISKLPKVVLNLVKDFYDLEKKMDWPLDLITTGSSYFIQQMDFCYCSKDISIIERSDKDHPENPESEYFFVDKGTNKLINLGKLSKDKYGMVLHVNTCRGFKVYNDGIYFSRLTFKNHKENSLIIEKISLPQ